MAKKDPKKFDMLKDMIEDGSISTDQWEELELIATKVIAHVQKLAKGELWLATASSALVMSYLLAMSGVSLSVREGIMNFIEAHRDVLRKQLEATDINVAMQPPTDDDTPTIH